MVDEVRERAPWYETVQPALNPLAAPLRRVGDQITQVGQIHSYGRGETCDFHCNLDR